VAPTAALLGGMLLLMALLAHVVPKGFAPLRRGTELVVLSAKGFTPAGRRADAHSVPACMVPVAGGGGALLPACALEPTSVGAAMVLEAGGGIVRPAYPDLDIVPAANYSFVNNPNRGKAVA